MELTDKTIKGPGSIANTTARLVRWARRSSWGLARVEFISEFARERVSNRLRLALAEAKIPFTEIELPTSKPASEVVRYMIDRLKDIESGVVSISGFATAFSPEVSLEDSLRVLNFNRENLALPTLRQIWWMPSHFAEVFTSAVPDLDSWFTLRLYLTEGVPLYDKRTSRKVSESPVSITEARQQAFNVARELQQRVNEGISIKEAAGLADNAINILRQVGAETQADLLAQGLYRLIVQSQLYPKVFISYSKDSEQDLERGQALSDRLLADGVKDVYDSSSVAGQLRRVAKQTEEADVIILVCTKSYLRNFLETVDFQGGVGTKWEAAIISQEIYSAEDPATSFIPVIFSPDDAKYIPPTLRHFSYYDVSTEQGYRALYLRLRRHKEIIASRIVRKHSQAVGEHTGDSISWNVPSRNPFFTGRGRILSEIDKKLASNAPVALVGAGGVGKTQMAIEYAYHSRNSYDRVFWIEAYSDYALSISFSEVARLLDLPEKDERSLDRIIASVHSWLDNNGNWLIIFDSVDDPDLLKNFWPRNPEGRILLTSRLLNFKEPSLIPIQLDVMSRQEGIEFLLKRTKREGSIERSFAAELAQELEYLPIALELAGAYMATEDMSFQKYLALLRIDISHLELENDDFLPFTLASRVSFYQLKAISKSAANLLCVSSFLGVDNIPLEFIAYGTSEVEFGSRRTLSKTEDDPITLYNLVTPLMNYSLIAFNSNSNGYSIHPLIQAMTRKMIDKEEVSWVERTVRMMNQAFPESKPDTWHLCDRLLPHTLVCADLIENWRVNLKEAAELLSRVGVHLANRVQYAKAEPLFRRALRIWQTITPKESIETAYYLNNLGMTYLLQGRYREAEPLLLESLRIQQNRLGETDPNVARALGRLARVYELEQEFEQAEVLLKRALSIQQQALGLEHPDVAATLHRLALLYVSEQRYAQAEELLRQSLAIQGRVLGSEHPDIARNLFQIALLYERQGRDEEALSFLYKALEILEKSEGLQHPDAADILNQLALIHVRNQRYDEAESLLRMALIIQERTLGLSHTDVAETLYYLAGLYFIKTRYSEAEELLKRALAIQEVTLGPNHINVIQSLKLYADLLYKTGREAEAQAIEARVKRTN